MSLVLHGTDGVTFNDSSLQAAAASPYVLKNRIINGDFRISQRGTTINGINADHTYTADRWMITRGGSINYTQGTTNPPTGFQYYGSFINQTASNPFITIQQCIESSNTYDLLGQTVTLSAWVKGAANTAASTSIILTYGYATTANTRYTVLVSGTTFALSSSSWTKCSITFTVPSNALTITPVLYTTNALAVNDGFLITGVQLEIGSTATPFERRMYGQELANCQRYCFVGTNANCFVAGAAASSTNMYIKYVLPMPMRATPTLSFVSSIVMSDQYVADFTATTPTVVSAPNIADHSGRVQLGGFSGLTTGRWYGGASNAGVAQSIFSAEL